MVKYMCGKGKGYYHKFNINDVEYIRYYYDGEHKHQIEFIKEIKVSDGRELNTHNENGPAIIHPNGDVEYWVNNIYFASRSKFLTYLSHIKTKEEAAEDSCEGKTVTIDGKDYTLTLKE